MASALIVGVGSCGCNVVDFFRREGLPEREGWRLEVLALNIPRDSETAVNRNHLPWLESPQHGHVDLRTLQAQMAAADAVIVLGSMVGRTGRLLLPLLAAMARIHRLPVSAILLLPFRFEGEASRQAGVQGCTAMHYLVERLEMVDNQHFLRTLSPQLSMLELFVIINRYVGSLCSMLLSEMDRHGRLS